MNKVFNQHYEILLEELSEITNPYERANVRVQLLGILAQLSDDESYIEESKGKEAIKNNKVKEVKEVKEDKPLDFEKEPGSEVEEIVDIPEEKVEVVSNDKELEEPNEIDLDHSVEETSEPMIIETEDGNVDITESYKLLKDFEGSEDEKLELAVQIAAYNLTAIYEGLNNLKDGNNKMMLAYYMSQYGLDEINEFISGLTDGTFNDIYEFINNENLDGFIANLEAAAEE